MNRSERYFPGDSEIFTYWKGRVALYALLTALDIGPGDEVILPGFTCVVVANAVLYRGATPIYADIDPGTYNITAESVRENITDNSRVILAQSTFGLSPDLDPILDLADEHGLVVIEDSAQGLGGSYKGRPNGTIAPAGFYSTQWSKPISTGIGGVAIVSDPRIAHRMGEISARMKKPSLIEELLLAGQLLARPLMDVQGLYYPLQKSYRWITQQLGLKVGSSTGEELQRGDMPEGYLKRMGLIQKRRWESGLKKLEGVVSARRTAAERYDLFFQERGLNTPFRPDYARHAMLRYVIRVENKWELLARARKLNIPLGDWFVSPLDPIRGDLSPWKYRKGMCPKGERAAGELINLYTDRPCSDQQLSVLFDY